MERFCLTIVIAAMTTASIQADEGGGTRDVIAQLAKKVREVSGGLKPAQTAVRIGLFTPSGDAVAFGAGGGAFMAELELALAGFLDRTAPLELNGQILYVDDPNSPGLKVVKVKAKLVDKNGDEPAEFKEFVGFVRRVTDIAKITGATVTFKPDDQYTGPPSEGRNKDVQKALPPAPGKKPEVQAFVEGTFVRSRKDSLYAVEIRTKPLNTAGEAKAKEATLSEGLAFVPIEKGEVYEVRVLNFSKSEIGVSLAIDGIDQFTFSEDRKEDKSPKFSHWVVAGCQGETPGEVLIVGWHKTVDPNRKDNVVSFLVTEYGKGAASKFPTLAQGKIGTITVGIAYSHPKDSNKGGTETGFGPPREVKQTEVKRKFEAPHEIITIRYNR